MKPPCPQKSHQRNVKQAPSETREGSSFWRRGGSRPRDWSARALFDAPLQAPIISHHRFSTQGVGGFPIFKKTIQLYSVNSGINSGNSGTFLPEWSLDNIEIHLSRSVLMNWKMQMVLLVTQPHQSLVCKSFGRSSLRHWQIIYLHPFLEQAWLREKKHGNIYDS